MKERINQPLAQLSAEDVTSLHRALLAEYQGHVANGLRLDLTRGKPSDAQLDLSAALLSLPGSQDWRSATGVDTRNYGGLEGLSELRKIFAELLHVDVEELLAIGNSSLGLMHHCLAFLMIYGVAEKRGWIAQAESAGQKIKFICPVPGYDRHFAMLAHLGIEMIPVPINDRGLDLVTIQELAEDPFVKGMFVVPMYSNPTGIIFDEETVRGLLSMPAAADFRIFWDNAYALHHLGETEPEPLPVLELAAECGNPDRVLAFASTSKITFPGAGVAFIALSAANKAWFSDHLSVAMIGPDKINQLRHIRFFVDACGVRSHMQQHRQLLAPKFDLVLQALQRDLGAAQIAQWTKPTGGYFVSLDVADHTARRVVELAKGAGLALTPAGSAFPHENDPLGRNIRLAPTQPPLEALAQAMDVLTCCVALAAVEQLG